MNDHKKDLQDANNVESEVQGLSQSDWEAIDLAAYNFAMDIAIDPEWLINEALQRILDGRRKWPPNNPTPFRNFFCGVMKSIRSEVCKGMTMAVAHYYAQIEDSILSPEEQITQQEREAWAKRVIESTFEHFSNDDDVLAIIIGKSSQMTGEEIRRQENLTRKQYDAALKRLSRYRNINLDNGVEK